MMLSFSFENFSKNRKKLKFFPTPALGTFFAHFTLWLLFHPNEWILIFKLSWSENMMLSFSSVNFSKNQKNWSFSPPRPLGHFLRISLFGSFFIQMSEFWYFTCPNVKIWCFPSVLKTFRKIEKNWSFSPPRPLGHFLRISLFGSFFIQMSEFWYFSCPKVKIWCFPSVL